MEKKEKYEQMYEMLVTYERKIHEKNQKRISIGLKCIIIIPLIFLFLLFWTESNKVVFLILWIVSLFLLAAYLILVEYMDYNLQEKLSEINDEGTRVDSLIGLEIDNVPGNLRNVIQRIDDGLNSEAETRLIETKASGEETQTVEKAQTAEETEKQKDADAQAVEDADAQKDAGCTGCGRCRCTERCGHGGEGECVIYLRFFSPMSSASAPTWWLSL